MYWQRESIAARSESDALRQRGDTYRARAFALAKQLRARRIGNRAGLKAAFKLVEHKNAVLVDALTSDNAALTAERIRADKLVGLLHEVLQGREWIPDEMYDLIERIDATLATEPAP